MIIIGRKRGYMIPIIVYEPITILRNMERELDRMKDMILDSGEMSSILETNFLKIERSIAVIKRELMNN